MNKLTFLLISAVLMASLPDNAIAQWNKSFGTTNLNILTEPQLRAELAKAKKTAHRGVAIGAVGGIAAIAGGVVYSSNLIRMGTAHYYNIDMFADRAMIGSYVMYGGIGLVGIALPLIISGYSTKAVIEIVLARSSATVAIKPHFTTGLNHFSAGLSVGLAF